MVTISDFKYASRALNKARKQLDLVGWLVVLGLTSLLDGMSVYIGQYTRDREKEKRNDRGE